MSSDTEVVEERVWIRSRTIKVMLRPPEHDDLQTVADGWGVPLATAAWAIVAGELARYRRRTLDLGRHELAISAALRVLQGEEP